MNRKDFFQTVRIIFDEGMVGGDLDDGPTHVVENREGPLREAMLFNDGDILYYGGGASPIEPIPVCEISRVEGVSFRSFDDRLELYLDMPSARICYEHHAMCEGDSFRFSQKGSRHWETGEAARQAMLALIHKPDSLEYSVGALFSRAMWDFEGDALDPETTQALELRLRTSADEGDALAAARYLALAEKAFDDDVREFFDEEYALERVMTNNAIREYEKLMWDEAKYVWSTEEVERTLDYVETYVIRSSLKRPSAD